MFNSFKKQPSKISAPIGPSPDDFARFVGYFTAHAIWQTEAGENVIPILAYQDEAGKQKLERVAADDYATAAAQAQQLFDNAKVSSRLALYAVDGYVTLPETGKLEAIIVTAHNAAPQTDIELAIPYRSATAPEGLVIYRPKILKLSVDPEAFFRAFWEGVDAHHQAAAFWNEHQDESK